MPVNSSRPEQGDPVRWIEFSEQMLVCSRLLRDVIVREAIGHQLSESEFSLLWACRKAPPSGIAQNELATELAVSAAQVSGLVERLRRKRLLEGYRPACDRRRQLWQLTPEGSDMLQAILAGPALWATRLDHAVQSEQLEIGRFEKMISEAGDMHHLMKLFNCLCETICSRDASPGKPATTTKRGAA